MTDFTYQAQLNQAIALHQQGNLQQAEHLYQKLILKIPENQDLLYYYGKLNLHSKCYKSAIYWLLKSLQKGPPKAHYCNTLAIAYQHVNQAELAKKYFKQAISLKSNFADAHHNLSLLENIKRSPASPQPFLEQILNCEVIAIFSCNSSGSIFLQSLFDSHPQVLMFPSIFLMNFHNPNQNRLTRKLQYASYEQAETLVELFCQTYLMCFDSSFDQTFELNALGPQQNTPLQVDQQVFKQHVLHILNQFQHSNQEFSRKIFFLSVHFAYAMAQGQDIKTKHTIIYHIHIPELNTEIQQTWLDFPYFKAIFTLRHPLKSIHSSLRRSQNRIQSHVSKRDYSFEDMVLNGHYHDTYRLQLKGYSQLIKQLTIPHYTLQLEALHNQPETSMQELANWCGLRWESTLLNSSFNGLTYWGSKMMRKKMSGFSNSYHLQDNLWKEHCGVLEAYSLCGILYRQFESYPHAKVSPLQVYLAPLLALLPTKLEQRALWKLSQTDAFRSTPQLLKLIGKRYQRSWRVFRGLSIE